MSVDAAAEAEAWKEEELCYNPLLSGRWYGIPIHEVKKEGLKELTELYIKQKKEFRSNIDAYITKEREADEANKRLVYEARRAETEAHLRAVETKRADNAEEEIRNLKEQLRKANQSIACAV